MTDAADRIRTAARTLRSHPKVLAVDALAPDEGPYAPWTLEATLDADACPPGVLHVLATARLSVPVAKPRGRAYHLIASL